MGGAGLQGKSTHPQQTPQVFTAALRVMQFVFGGMGVGCHTLALRIGEGVGLQTCQGQVAVVFAQGRGDSTDEPVFEDPHTANAALIEVVPVIEERLPVGLEGLVVQQLQESTLKGFAICFMLKLIAGKMDVMAPARRLPTEIPEIKQVVGPDQDVHYPCNVRHGLDPIELVEEFHPKIGRASCRERVFAVV